MGIPSTATLDYFVNPIGSAVADLMLMIAPSVIPLDVALWQSLGVTITSDVVSNQAGRARRRVVVNLRQSPFIASAANAPVSPIDAANKMPFILGVRSTSADDTAAGTGVRTLRVAYLDESGGAQAADFTMAGRTEVFAGATQNFNNITGVTFLTTGAFDSNKGQISLVGHGIPRVNPQTIPERHRVLNGSITGTPMGYMPPSFFVDYLNVATSTVTGDAVAVFNNWLTSALEYVVGPVITKTVVFA